MTMIASTGGSPWMSPSEWMVSLSISTLRVPLVSGILLKRPDQSNAKSKLACVQGFLRETKSKFPVAAPETAKVSIVLNSYFGVLRLELRTVLCKFRRYSCWHLNR